MSTTTACASLNSSVFGESALAFKLLAQDRLARLGRRLLFQLRNADVGDRIPLVDPRVYNKRRTRS
jgi:hypothetical protein